MNTKLLSEFQSPGSAYRGKPFWAWNGRLTPPELRRQIRIMHRMGLGGFFMHSRVGLATPYLSREWFDCVRACVDEARQLGMEAWLYDEDRWPSGAAGGLVTCQPRYRLRALALRRLARAADLKWDADTVAVFRARISGTDASRVRRLARGERPRALEKGEELLVFRVELSANSDWYNGYTYLDTLNDKAVREFIRVTHERYRREVGAEFGGAVPGIFTDEPNYGSALGGGVRVGGSAGVPWTRRLSAAFRARHGYALEPRLPELFFDVDGVRFARTRVHYYDCITHLFVDAFARQIGAWCDRNRLLHTGHALAEDTLSSQTHAVGAAMRFYEYMQAPGMDLLTERWRIYDVAKQVSSMARQFGRKWRLTETYGCTGWDFPLAGHKALGDWQVALGINVRCQHLSWYTMAGEAKRDYPAGIFYQSPWWALYPKVEDYFGRVLAVMTRGAEVRDLLVVHPIESQWGLFRLGWEKDPAVRKRDQALVRLRDTLLSAHVDFDFGDEDVMARHARTARAGGAARFKVARAEYRAVLVPALETIRSSTLALLRRFKAAGGLVVFAGPAPTHVDGAPSAAAAALASECVGAPADGPGVVAAVEGRCRRVSIRAGAGGEIAPALYLLREDADGRYLFVCNTGHSAAQMKRPLMGDVHVCDRRQAFADVRVRLAGAAGGPPLELDPQTGAHYRAAARRTAAGWEVRTSLPRLGSRLFVFPKRAGGAAAARPKLTSVRRQTLGAGRWDYALAEPNVLVLDRLRHRVADGAWQAADEVLRVDHKIRDALGLHHRGGAMVQPWARMPTPDAQTRRVELAYRFDVAELPSGELCLALEEPERFAVMVNGTALSRDLECGWWVDTSLRKLPLDAGLLRQGRNEVRLACDYGVNGPNLEIAYLLGRFGAKVAGADVTLTRLPERLRLGDWVPQGLPFYSGAVSYLRRVRCPALSGRQRLFVEVPDYRGTAVRVIANGRVAGVVAWEPNEVDVTDCLDGQTLALRIEVVSHRRNSHGPLHLRERWPAWHGPGAFVYEGARDDGKTWVKDYRLVPCGLMQAPRLVVKRVG